MEIRNTSQDKLSGQSDAISNVIRALRLLEGREFKTALISGEVGTQKSVAAGILHKNGARRAKPMLSINCDASSDLVFANLLGDSPSDLEQFWKKVGTLFLCHIDRLSLKSQERVLSLLRRQNGEQAHEWGAVIASTRLDLKKRVKEGQFLLELYELLTRFHVQMPSISQRISDIEALSLDILASFRQENWCQAQGLSPDAVAFLQQMSFSKNVRQLQNVLEQAAWSWPHVKQLSSEHFGHQTQESSVSALPATTDFSLPQEGVVLEDLEKNLIVQALKRTKENQSRAARLLGITRFALRYRMEKYGLFPDRHTGVEDEIAP